ncbi:MAG: helix-turn-helix domain-containing protein, partial [Hyphomicrobiales bacterium]|nr:helix-turn-helix domain-containing protein [Hyphomicrobiales bacterium]
SKSFVSSFFPIIKKLETNDFEEMSEAYIGWDERYRQLDSGRFRGSLLFSQIDALQICHNLWWRSIHYQGTTPPDTFGVAVTLNQGNDGRWMGMEVGPADMIIQKMGKEADFVAQAEWDGAVFSIPKQAFAQLASDLGGCAYGALPEFGGLSHLTQKEYSRIRSLCLAYFDVLERSSHDPASSVLIPHMAQSLVSEIARALVASLPLRFEKPAPSRRRQIVRQAERYISGCENRSVRIEHVCRALGVSERTLYYAFADTIGETPTHWLRNQRLNQAYRSLYRADPADTLVKQVAIGNGFLHLGHFSRNYKKLFGESPSETLRR